MPPDRKSLKMSDRNEKWCHDKYHPQDTVYREKRKLKKLHGLYLAGEKDIKLIENQYRSWREEFKKYLTVSQINMLDNTYNDLFIKPFLKGAGNGNTCYQAG